MKLNQEQILGEHPDARIPGVEADSGSLGHGLGIATGLALSNLMDKKDNIIKFVHKTDKGPVA